MPDVEAAIAKLSASLDFAHVVPREVVNQIRRFCQRKVKMSPLNCYVKMSPRVIVLVVVPVAVRGRLWA
jgi:hypothetical protein